MSQLGSTLSRIYQNGNVTNNFTTIIGGALAADPTAEVILTAVTGEAVTFMRSDAAPPLSQAIAPTWTNEHIWQPSSATMVPAIVRGHTSQSVDIFRVTNAAATERFFHVSSVGTVGVGFASSGTPLSMLHSVVDQATSPVLGSFLFDAYGDSVLGAVVGRRSRGTRAAPLRISSANFTLSGVLAAGSVAADDVTAATFPAGSPPGSLEFFSRGAFTASSRPTAFQIHTTASGSTARIPRLTISEDGNVGIGLDTSTAPYGAMANNRLVVIGPNSGGNTYQFVVAEGAGSTGMAVGTDTNGYTKIVSSGGAANGFLFQVLSGTPVSPFFSILSPGAQLRIGTATTNYTQFTMPPPGTPATISYTLPTSSSNGFLRNTASVWSWDDIDLATGDVTGVLPLTNGGTSKALTAVNGGIVYTDADSMEVTAAGTSSQVLIGGTPPSFSSLSGAGIVAGSGTLDWLPLWTPDGVTLGDSLAYQGVGLPGGLGDATDFQVYAEDHLTNEGGLLGVFGGGAIKGGHVYVIGGTAGETSSTGGPVLLRGGHGVAAGGSAEFSGGDCTDNGQGGSGAFNGGNGGPNGGHAGGISFNGGDAQLNANGGDISFTTGFGHGTGINGVFRFSNDAVNAGVLNFSAISADRIFSFPDLAGTIALTANKLSVFAATTSAELAGVISDENGSGKLIFADGTLAITSGKTLTATHSLTLAGTDSTTHTFPATTSVLARTDAAQTFTGVQTFTDGIKLGATSGRIDSIVGTSPAGGNAGDIQLLYQPSVALTSGTDRFIHSFKDSAGNVGLCQLSNGTWSFNSATNTAAYVLISGTIPASANIGLSATPTFGAASGTSIGGVASAIAGFMCADIDSVSATATGVIAGAFINFTIAGRAHSDIVGGLFSPAASITSNGTIAHGNIYGWRVRGIGTSMGTSATAIYGGHIPAMLTGVTPATTDAYGIFIEEQVQATNKYGIWLGSATSGYKAIAIGDANTTIGGKAGEMNFNSASFNVVFYDNEIVSYDDDMVTY